MKSLLFLVTLMTTIINANAQGVGINTTGAAPDTSAMLDINSTDKGVLIPRVALTSMTDATTISGPATSLLVYNDGTGGLIPAGFYYNSGTPTSPDWSRIGDVSGKGQMVINKTTSQLMNAAWTTILNYQSSTTNGNTAGRFTANLANGSITVTNAGFYHIKAVGYLTIAHSTGAASISLFKNGAIFSSDFKSMGEFGGWPATPDDWGVSVQGVYYLNAGDVITVASGGSATIASSLLTVTTSP